MATVYLRQCVTAVRCLKFHKPAKTVLNSSVSAVSIFRSGSSSGAVSKASSRLLQCLNEEIRLEKKVPDNLPAVGKFNVQINGSLATLVQNHGQEKIQVLLDANSAIEVVQDEDTEDGGEPLFVPTFTVTVSKPGTSVQFDCSFDESGSYEEGSEWEYMHIDSVTVLPDNSATTEHIYSADAENLNEELYSSLVDYLKERGINEKFATDIFRFYAAFEHKRYIHDFLKPLKSFIQNN